MDADTGLVYAQQRYYDPVIGRFLSVDPVGVDTSNGSNFSRYWYANNNPYRFTDPDGRSPIEIAFFVADAIELANSISSGEGIGLAALNAVIDVVGVVSPVPGISAAAHAIEGAQKVERVVEVAKSVEKAADAGKVFSKEKQALVDMAKADKKTGITSGDMKAFKDLNKKLPDPFPTNKVRGPEAHPTGAASSQAPHGYVGPVDHIPVKDKK